MNYITLKEMQFTGFEIVKKEKRILSLPNLKKFKFDINPKGGPKKKIIFKIPLRPAFDIRAE